MSKLETLTNIPSNLILVMVTMVTMVTVNNALSYMLGMTTKTACYLVNMGTSQCSDASDLQIC